VLAKRRAWGEEEEEGLGVEERAIEETLEDRRDLSWRREWRRVPLAGGACTDGPPSSLCVCTCALCVVVSWCMGSALGLLVLALTAPSGTWLRQTPAHTIALTTPQI
jgi:hypothetical protein